MEPKPERKRLWLAIIASLLVHVLVALSLAVFNSGAAVPLPENDKPLELTMVDLPNAPPAAAAVPTPPRYMETDPSRETKEEPTEKTFESNANSRAASMQPASGEAPLPSQEGKDRSSIDLQTQQSTLPSEAAAAPQPPPQPMPVAVATPTPPMATPRPTASQAPSATPKPKQTPLPEPLETPEPDKLAMLTSTPPPALRDAQEVTEATPPAMTPTATPVVSRPVPPRPVSIFQREQTQTRIRGRIGERGASAVNAVSTPLGRYQKAVSDAIGVRWYSYMKSKLDIVSVGTAVVSAEVDPRGHVTNLRVVSNSANEAFANVCLQSFQEAEIAPIPPDLVATLPDGKMQLEFTFTTYANR